MSSSNPIVKIICHTITFRHASSCKERIALTFVKPRGGEGQNGWLKCPLGFLVRLETTSPGDIFSKIQARNVQKHEINIVKLQ